MFNEKNVGYGESRSSIRELFEYGRARKAEIGDGRVFDFSLGNPSVPAPEAVGKIIRELTDGCDPVVLHGYTSAQGDAEVRGYVSDSINRRFSVSLTPDCIYMTCGAAASLTITLNALLNPGDEVILFAPYFPEYRVFIEHAGGVPVEVMCDIPSFEPDADALAAAITPRTRAVIMNSPNNPSGAVYKEGTVRKICAVLGKASERYGDICLISDEPYREVVYDGVSVPYIMNFYAMSVVCYSYSKSLSLPGERIGYIAVNNAYPGYKKLYAAVCGAGRALGYVCAPSLFQRLIMRADGLTSDISVYKANRDRLMSALTEYGFGASKPEGAFYLFVRVPGNDARAFSEMAKKYEILVVPGDDFGCPGYVRVSYCVSPDMIERSLPAFRALAGSCKK